MILVTVGTHNQPFDRLLAEIDNLATEYDREIVAQVGHSDYRPKHMEWFDFVSETEIHDYYERTSLVIGHAGAGTILTALSHGKPLVIVPRRKRHGEHLDNHQLELTEALRDRVGIFVAETVDDLEHAIDEALQSRDEAPQTTGELAHHLADNLENMV